MTGPDVPDRVPNGPSGKTENTYSSYDAGS